VLENFEAENLVAAAITDHDTFAGVNEVLASKRQRSVGILPAVEISAECQGIPIEILGYFGSDYKKLDDSGIIKPVLVKDAGAELLVEKLRKQGIIIDPFDKYYRDAGIMPFVATHSELQEKHGELLAGIDTKLVCTSKDDKVIGKSTKYLFREHIFQKESPLAVDFGGRLPSAEEVIRIIRDFGGDAILAHPFDYGEKSAYRILECLKGKVDGVECHHQTASGEKLEYLLQLCAQHGLLVTGGSDFHGRLGGAINSQKVPAQLIKQFDGKIL